MSTWRDSVTRPKPIIEGMAFLREFKVVSLICRAIRLAPCPSIQYRLGVVLFYSVKSLLLLYCVRSAVVSFRVLNFTLDSSSLFDVMNSGMCISASTAITGKDMEEDSSTSGDVV